MSRYFVYACDQMYGGLHGINDFVIVETDKPEDLYRDWIVPMSLELMESYSEITESLESEAAFEYDEYEDREEYDEYLEDLMYQNVDGYYVKIKDNVSLSTRELERLAFDMGNELFVEKYCE